MSPMEVLVASSWWSHRWPVLLSVCAPVRIEQAGTAKGKLLRLLLARNIPLLPCIRVYTSTLWPIGFNANANAIFIYIYIIYMCI